MIDWRWLHDDDDDDDGGGDDDDDDGDDVHHGSAKNPLLPSDLCWI